MTFTRTQETLIILAVWFILSIVAAFVAVIAWYCLMPDHSFLWMVIVVTGVWNFAWGWIMKVYKRRWQPRIVFR
jgi:hypothetical protein